MNLTREQAEKIALEYVRREQSGNYTLNLLRVEVSQISPKYWAASFEVRAVTGNVIDGPLLILVDDESQKAMSLEEAVYLANRKHVKVDE
jgi:hypothetical protein